MCIRNGDSPDADMRRDRGEEFPESERQDPTNVVLACDVRCVCNVQEAERWSQETVYCYQMYLKHSSDS